MEGDACRTGINAALRVEVDLGLDSLVFMTAGSWEIDHGMFVVRALVDKVQRPATRRHPKDTLPAINTAYTSEK